MAKNISISVPEKLFEKMQKWKGSFSPSKVFQDAVKIEIQKKENLKNFKNGIVREENVEYIVERLNKEKAGSLEDYYEHGKRDGLQAATNLSYEAFQYALQHEPLKYAEGFAFNFDPDLDKCFGDYYKEAYEKYALIGEERIAQNMIPNEYFNEWQAGFIDGIKEFWEEIADKINP